MGGGAPGPDSKGRPTEVYATLRLQAETTVTSEWTAARLRMANRSNTSNLVDAAPNSSLHISHSVAGAPVCDRLTRLATLKAGHRPALHPVGSSNSRRIAKQEMVNGAHLETVLATPLKRCACRVYLPRRIFLLWLFWIPRAVVLAYALSSVTTTRVVSIPSGRSVLTRPLNHALLLASMTLTHLQQFEKLEA